MTTLYRLLLRLYPRAFRLRHGEAMLQAVREEQAAIHGDGLLLRLELWRFLLTDLFVSVCRIRIAAARQRIALVRRGPLPDLPAPPRRGIMDTLTQDLRYAFRQFVRRPGFTAVAVISLALGIGGNSLIFGLLDGFVFNPFHYPDPDRLVAVGVTFPKVSAGTTYVEALSVPEYGDIKRSRSFARVAAFDLGNRNVSGGDVPERVFTAFLMDDLFPVLGMRPHLGRGFSAEELGPDGPPAAILSHRIWQSRFGGDPQLVGRTIRIGGEATTVVGIMPPGLVLTGTDMWLPWGGDPAQMPRGARQFTILARLAADASLQSANAELATVAAQVQQEHAAAFKEYDGWRLRATPWAAALLQDVRPAAGMLLAAVGLVLLIACANLANMMLARSTTRTREIAVRLALGAGRWRLARQLLTESLMLACAGGAAGLVLAHVGLQFAGALIPAEFQALGLEAGINVRVLLWSAVLVITAALLVSILPAIQAGGTDPHESLKSDGRAGSSAAAARVRQALVVGEIALSVVLLLGAGLLMRTMFNLQRVDPGFEPHGVLTMRLTLPVQKYSTGESITSFFEQLTARVQTIPGVTAAAMASQFPPAGTFSAQIEVEGVPPSGGALPTASTTIASRDFFHTLGIPLIRGRAFGPEDSPDAPQRTIVNAAFADRYLQDREAVGARIRIIGREGPGDWAEIVGVVADVRNAGLGVPVRPEVFIPMEQGRDVWNQLFLLVRSAGAAETFVAPVRAAVAALDPEQPVYAIRTLDEALATSAFQQRIAAVLLAVFAGVALTLAALGIYGVMSYSVSARTQEIGVRMAMGAQTTDVMRLVLLQVLGLVAIGLALGVGGLLAAAPAFRQLLFGVSAADAVTIAAVSLTLACVAFIAGWIPARRASRVNPIDALRAQ